MRKLTSIVQDPGLEEYLIYYVGLRHMHAHWEQFLDPALPYEWTLLEVFYKEMRKGTFDDLKGALQKKHGIHSSDPDFKPLLAAAIRIIVNRHGMDQILATAREFLHIIASTQEEVETLEVDFSAPAIRCPNCNKLAISLGYEDLPRSILKTEKIHLGDLFGFCKPCAHIFRVAED